MSRYYLRRESDGAGDSGPMSETFLAGSAFSRTQDARPTLGLQIRVGSYFGRTMQMQDWWQTSPVTEIVEDTPNRVVFKTKNSTYIWECEV